MRVLVTTIPAAGHLTPIVPLAWSLRGAGHEVLVACQPNIAAAVRSTGLSAVPAGPAFDVMDFFRARLPEGATPAQAWTFSTRVFFAAAARTWTAVAETVVGDMLDFAREWRPDLVLSDPMELAGRMVAGVLGVPVVLHRWGVDPLADGFDDGVRRHAARITRRLGLSGLPEPEFVLDPCPRELQMPQTTAGRPVRYVPFNGAGAVPPLNSSAKARRVCVTFGSVVPALNGEPLLRRAIRAVRDIGGTEAVVAVPARFADSIGQVPGEVSVYPDVPLNLLLTGCDAIVHHGGSGSGMTGLSYGLPQVVLPQYADQYPWGERIEACGAGLSLTGAQDQANADRIRDAIGAVLDKPGFQDAAVRLRDEIAAQPPPASIVPDLERVAGEWSGHDRRGHDRR